MQRFGPVLRTNRGVSAYECAEALGKASASPFWSVRNRKTGKVIPVIQQRPLFCRGTDGSGVSESLHDEKVYMALDSFLKVDSYSWRARIAPVLVALLPVPLAVFVCFPGSSVVARVVAILGAPALLLWLLSEIGRDLGKRKEPKLWQSWGGAPTTQRLRFATPHTNVALVERYHRLLNELNPTLDLPTAEDEASDPQSADQAYEVATKWLIDKTRNTDMFQLLFKENVSYGFRRKPVGPQAAGVAFGDRCGGAMCCLWDGLSLAVSSWIGHWPVWVSIPPPHDFFGQ